MSHASVIVAVSPESIKQLGGIENAVAEQMYPFDENGECFRDGSRWDWYQIGGRYTGKFSDYDPDRDPRNWKKCWLCNGTGKRPDMHCENGCNGCNGTGTAREFSNAPAPAGSDIIQVKALNLSLLKSQHERSCRETYAKAQNDKYPDHCKLIYGVDPREETLEEYLKRNDYSLAAYGFLRERHWHEPERLGWFGGSAYTECEIAAKKSGNTSVEEMIRRCKFRDPETGAVVVCWNEPWEVWSKLYYQRFIEPLPEDVTLVNVDYHV